MCDSETGQQVCAGIVDGGFAINLLATVLPFAVVLAVAAVIHLGVPGTRKKHGPSD